jgi:hypothetical protein
MTEKRQQEDEPIEAEFTESPSGDPEDPSAPTEIVTVLEESTDIVKMAETMEERALAFATVMRHALNATFPEDWVVHGDSGGAFLMGKGADRLMTFLSIGFSDMELTKENRTDSDGDYYQYRGKARFTWMGRTIQAEGGASCRHNRLSKGGRLSPQDVNETDVRTFAQTNLVRIGVTRILGLKDYPISELPEKTRTGQTFRDRVGRVDYQSRTQGGRTSDKGEREMQDDLKKWAAAMFETPTECQDWLEQLSEYTGKDDKLVKGIRNPDRLTGGRLRVTHDKAKKDYDRFMGGE